MTEELLYLWFGMISRMTHTVKMNVAMKYGGIRGLWNTSEEQLRDELTQAQADGFLEHRDAGKVAAYAEELRRNDITYIYPGHKLYPGKLYDIPDPPMLLFAAGDVDVLADLDPAVAVVGARKASVYGMEAADRLSGELAASGVTIVSGMALGIDGAAHRAAMKAGGKTVAVLGSGINVPYPRENYDIYHDIRNGGGVVLSECGLDIRPDAFRFPYRNRIISGLSSGVLIVEAREKSGSLITADQALEQGREVYAVPGRITDSGSRGCNGLIRMGAVCVTQVEDILDEMGINRAESKAFNKNLLAPAEKKVYSCVRLESRHIDDICFETGISVSEVTQILYELEQKRLIKQLVRIIMSEPDHENEHCRKMLWDDKNYRKPTERTDSYGKKSCYC